MGGIPENEVLQAPVVEMEWLLPWLSHLDQHLSQKKAAIDGMKKTGINPLKPVDPSRFAAFPQYRGMFLQQMALLQTV